MLRDCRRRHMRALVRAAVDGALGFWPALREVSPDTREQRCWFHKQANVLSALPKSAHPGALAALRDIYNAEDIEKAQVAVKAFELDYGAKYPKAVAKITDDLDTLLEFYKYPADHWIHLRTTNPIESTFATVRLRQRVTKGPGSRAAGVAMAFKLIESAHYGNALRDTECGLTVDEAADKRRVRTDRIVALRAAVGRVGDGEHSRTKAQ